MLSAVPQSLVTRRRRPSHCQIDSTSRPHFRPRHRIGRGVSGLGSSLKKHFRSCIYIFFCFCKFTLCIWLKMSVSSAESANEGQGSAKNKAIFLMKTAYNTGPQKSARIRKWTRILSIGGDRQNAASFNLKDDSFEVTCGPTTEQRQRPFTNDFLNIKHTYQIWQFDTIWPI